MQKYNVVKANGRDDMYLVVARRFGGHKTIRRFVNRHEPWLAQVEAQNYADALNNGDIKETIKK